MAHLSDYCNHIIDRLTPYGTITARAMFGGYGIYRNGVITAIIVDDTLYFKVDASNQKQYEDYGATPFTYQGKHKLIQMSYWQVPEAILEDDEQLGQWLQQSWAISNAAR